MTKQELKFNKAIEDNDLTTITLLFNDDDFDPSYDDNFAIWSAAEKGLVDIARLLLTDKRVDPSSSHNHSICEAQCLGLHEMVELLLNDERVRNNLKDDLDEDEELYDNIILENADLLAKINIQKKAINF
jgi:hypothetical protein